MDKNAPFNLWLSILACLALAACNGGGATVINTPTDAPKTTSSGFVCPAPEFPIETTSTELNLFVWTEFLPAEMIECFEMVYGVKVSRDEYSSDEDMYDGISGGGSNYDLVLPSDYMAAKIISEGLLQELDHVRLPALKNFDPNYLDFEFDPGNRYTIPYLAGTDAIVVNTGKVENIPQSWADLWNPEYNGRMVFLDDARAVIGITLLSLGHDINTTDSMQLEEARNKLIELVPGIKLFDSDSPKTALLAGAVDVGMIWSGEAFIARQGNPDIQYVFPSEGVIIWQDNWGIPKNAPHSDAAYAWLNYINQGNIFWMVLRDFPYTNPNMAALEFARDGQMKVLDVNGGETSLATLYTEYMESPITNISIDNIRNGHRIADVGEASPLYYNIWDEVRNGQ
ncbi:Spermidine/putrescine-binding periplasmic protein [Anaerolineales bacterium]|nr:Spermidine/putrescine-binding periplasmic protein [Anaerolineales bacterium]